MTSIDLSMLKALIPFSVVFAHNAVEESLALAGDNGVEERVVSCELNVGVHPSRHQAYLDSSRRGCFGALFVGL